MARVVFCAVALLLLVSVEAKVKTCKPDMKHRCKAKCSGTDLDMTKVFKDGKFTDQFKDPVTGNLYTYVFDCNGADCSKVPKSAVCQQSIDGREWSVGIVTAATWYLNSSSVYTVIYRQGNDSRMIFLTFYEGAKSTNVTFVQEDPDTSAYFFDVRAKDVGISSGDIAGSIGVVIALAVIFFILFLIIGIIIIVIIIMKFSKGATGNRPCLKRSGYEKL